MLPRVDDRAVEGRHILAALNRFAHPRAARSWSQVVATTALLVASVAAARATSPVCWLAIAPTAGLLVRVFVLQHDCGHHSLFRGRAPNDVVGTLLSFITGVPYEPWRTEHAWHHTHQAQLEARGVDRVNSPMTVDEALRDPAQAAQRGRLIRPWTVFLLGFFSLLVKRKSLRGFFHFRPGFRGRVADPRAQVRGYLTSLVGHVAAQCAMIAALGLARWAAVIVPAYVIAGGCGALIFWVQHNFERTYHAPSRDWRYLDVGLRGSSYVALPQPLRWITADIGIHHVHHLHPRIPNYELDAARRAIPALAAVAPLDRDGFARCFTHVFWDPRRDRMVPFDALSHTPPEG